MPANRLNLRLVICVLAIAAFIALFLCRSVDDNRLTSWRWVFDAVGAGKVYFALAASLIAAWPLSRYDVLRPWVLFAASFAVASAFWSEPELIVDASRYFTQAKTLEMYGAGYFIREWGGEIFSWTDLPFAPFCYGLIFKFMGESRIYIQIFTTLLFSLTVAITYLVGRDLWDEVVGSAASAFMLGMPYLFTQVPLMLVDVPSMFALMFSVWAVDRAVMHGGIARGGLAVAAILGAVFTKYSLWPMLSVLPVLWLVRLKGEKPSRRGAVALRGGLVFLSAGLFAGGFMLYKYDEFAGQMALLFEYQRPGLGRWAESYVSTFLFQVHPFITAGALYSVVAALRKKDIKYIVAAWLFLLLALAQVKRIRYTVPLFPMLSLMAAYGVNDIKDLAARRYVVLSAVAASVAVAVFAYLPFLEGFSMRNLRDAGAYLDTLKEDRVRVFVLSQGGTLNAAVSVPLLDLFTRKDIVFEYRPGRMPSPRKRRESALRFTWEYRNPRYYEPPGRLKMARGETAVAVIARKVRDPLPEGVKKTLRGYAAERVFDAGTKLFRYRTVVTVYHAER